MLRPGYSPPSRYDVGGKLLDKVQGSLMNTCRQKLENKTVSFFGRVEQCSQRTGCVRQCYN